MMPKEGACDPVLLDRLFDGEATADERRRLEAHVTGCAACRRHLEGNRAIAGLMRDVAAQRMTSAEKTSAEDRLIARIARHRRSKLRPARLIPLAAALGLLVWVFTSFLRPAAPSGPSAIVTSFQGDYTSVMIVETPDTRNTIIWFDETS